MKQEILRICNDNRIRKQSLEAMGKLAIPQKEPTKKWLMLREFLCQVRGFTRYGIVADNRSWLPVDERDALPVSPYRDELLLKTERDRLLNKSTLAEESNALEEYKVEKNTREPWWVMPIKWVTIVSATVFGLVVLLVAAHRFDAEAIMKTLGDFIP